MSNVYVFINFETQDEMQSGPTTLFGVDAKNGVGQFFTPNDSGKMYLKKCQKSNSRNFSDPIILYIIGKLSKNDIKDF